MEIYELEARNITEHVPTNVPGSYLLGEIDDNVFDVRYVGRSDSCLRSRLLCHARNGEHGFFALRVCKTPREAFLRECYAYHTYRGLGNIVHPATNGHCVCPICDVIHEFSTAIEADQERC